MESKALIKFNEEAENNDFTLLVPHNCPFEHLKKGIIVLYEHIVRAEYEQMKIELDKKEKELPVDGEVAEEKPAVEAELVQ